MQLNEDQISFVPLVTPIEYHTWINPSKWYVKGIILLLISLVSVGFSYSGENISAVQEIVISNMQLSDVQYNLIFSFYSIPNIVLVIFGGIMVDRIGQRWSSVLFSLIVALGQLMICVGIYKNIYGVLLAGRLLFGIGCESLGIALTKYTILWFDGSMLNVSFGLQVAVSKFAMFLSMLLTHRIYNWLLLRLVDYSKLVILTIVFSIGLAGCILSVLFSILLFIIDKYRVEQVEQEHVTLSRERNQWKIAKKFSATYWLIILYICIFYLPFSSYNGIAILYFEYKNHLSADIATSYLSIYSLVGIFACIFFGFLVGRVGFDILWFYLAPLLCIIGHVCYVFANANPIVLMVFRGIGSAFVVCSAWPAIRYVVPDNGMGLAFGIAQSLQNLGLTLAPILIGFLIDNYGYLSVEIFIEYCFSITIILASIIMMADKIKTSGILMMSAWRKRNHLLCICDISFDHF